VAICSSSPSRIIANSLEKLHRSTARTRFASRSNPQRMSVASLAIQIRAPRARSIACKLRSPITVSLENLEMPERMEGYITFIILANSHFSHDTPRNSVFDLPFACCPRAGEPGSASEIRKSGSTQPRGKRRGLICNVTYLTSS
jgi:hypothetical protein